MGLLSGFKAKLKSNKHKKSPDIVCVNYKITSSFDDPGSSYTYRTTAIWNNSPKSTDKNKTSIRSPTIKRTSTSSTTSETGRKGIHNKNSFSPQSIQDKENEIKHNNENVLTHTNTYNNNEDTNQIVRKEVEESPCIDIDYMHSNHSDHSQEADENIKSVLIFMTEDHDGRKLYDSDKNNNEYGEYTGREDNNAAILTSHDNGSEGTTSDESILKNETEEVLLREDTSRRANETGKSVRFAEENSYHSITPTIIRAYYFEPEEENENEYEVRHVDLDNLSPEELEEREDEEEEEGIDENGTNIQDITQHDTYSLHYYNGMAFSSQASNIFFGGEDFDLDKEEEKSEENTSRASSCSA